MSTNPGEDHPLDNPVWYSLRDRLSRFVSEDSTPDWLRFDPEVGLFTAVDRIDESMWSRIAALVGLEGTCGLFRDAVGALPGGWETLFRGVCWQMIAGDLPPTSDLVVEELGLADAEDMLALAQLTEPGPYFIRTRELGRYVGVRRAGRLVAMAGERFRVPGFVEISAVCTHADVRGKGLAGGLTLDVARSIRAQGDEAFLHVLDSNENAFRLYLKLGFTVRRRVEVVFAQWHGVDWLPND